MPTDNEFIESGIFWGEHSFLRGKKLLSIQTSILESRDILVYLRRNVLSEGSVETDSINEYAKAAEAYAGWDFTTWKEHAKGGGPIVALTRPTVASLSFSPDQRESEKMNLNAPTHQVLWTGAGVR